MQMAAGNVIGPDTEIRREGGAWVTYSDVFGGRGCGWHRFHTCRWRVAGHQAPHIAPDAIPGPSASILVRPWADPCTAPPSPSPSPSLLPAPCPMPHAPIGSSTRAP
jgi:hypothetical protein